MDKHVNLEVLSFLMKEAELAILRQDNTQYNIGFKKVVEKTIEMINDNQNIVSILNKVKEYKSEAELHSLSLFYEGSKDAATEVLGILYDSLD